MSRTEVRASKRKDRWGRGFIPAQTAFFEIASLNRTGLQEEKEPRHCAGAPS